MKYYSFAMTACALTIVITIGSNCSNKSSDDTFQEIYPEASALTPGFDTFSINLNTFNNLPHGIRNQFYMLATNPSTGFSENFKAVASTPVFHTIFTELLSKCGITVNKNSLITASHNVKLGDVYKIGRQSKQVQTYQTTMNKEIKPEWSKIEEKSIDCIGAGSGGKKDTIELGIFKVKLNTRLTNFSFAQVEFNRIRINEVEALRIKRHIKNDPGGIMAEAMAGKDNFVAVRTIEFPEISFSFISNRSKGGSINLDEPIDALEFKKSQVSSTKQRNDTITITFKNITALTDFIRYEYREINRKQ